MSKKSFAFCLALFSAFGGLMPLPSMAAEVYDLVIRNGQIVDGSGNPWFWGDVAVQGDQIVKVGKLGDYKATRTIEAKGLVVAPGFIDMLGQSAYTLLIDPRAESKIFQGITTEITGEGESVAPANDYTLVSVAREVSPYGLKADFRTLDQYFRYLEKHPPGINLATYVGAGQVRKYVLHDDDRPPTQAELDQMRTLVAQQMEQGAIGISTALLYAPGSYAKTEELIELSKVVARYGGIYASHMRDESDKILDSIDEVIRIGKSANLPVEIFHLKMAGKQNWGRMEEALKKINEARKAGVDITADQYPYIASGTSLAATIPNELFEGGNEKLIVRLKDPAMRKQLKTRLNTPSKTWENLYLNAGKGKGIFLVGIGNPQLKKYQGKFLSEVAALRGQADELDTLFDLLIESKNQVFSMYFEMNENDVRLAMKQPWLSFCTDAEATATSGVLSDVDSFNHPRAFGSFSKILGLYVRETEIMTLEEAIRRMTAMPAERMHLEGRGLLKAGNYADIAIFDPQKIGDRATFAKAKQLPVGMEYVLVNGQLVLAEGKLTNALPGRPLRGPGYKVQEK
ncbi:MAG: D-aminoacylase [Anaerolineae bacterium]|nr:D-aminoacylase [Gloeobacterales cyanobacterium ES-bin-313]